MLAERLAALPGWQVLRDVPTAIGPVALLAIGPAGVHVVESASSPCAHTPADVPERRLIHAWALARHLTDVLGTRVTPVLAVDARLDGLGGRRRGVHVVDRELAPNWLAARPATLPPAALTAIATRAGAERPIDHHSGGSADAHAQTTAA